MQVLLYNELNPKKIPGFSKIRKYLENNDFKSADVRKVGDNLYRARLDRSNRLLFALYHYNGERYALILEFIKNHAYAKSRFLRGESKVDEGNMPPLSQPKNTHAEPLVYLNTTHPSFNLLDKIISFDDAQQRIFALSPPLIIIGSAGSGKTALTLEKMKQAVGDILYITRSPYLVHNSRNLYYALDYANDDQEIVFLSFDDYLASIHVPEGKELPFRQFAQWFSRHRLPKQLKDPYQIFEEFKGVITGPLQNAYLNRDDYLNLGIKQSIFSPDDRNLIYDLFEKYLQFMREEGYYDSNILSHDYLARVEPRYDFIVVDEVQDLTTIQLQLVLRALHDPHKFILCGDSNQIVHPNFFSWSKVKSLFYQQQGYSGPAELLRVLNTNYRNSPEVTELANRVLKIKTSRFGSIDRESNFLVHSNAHNNGTTILLQEQLELLRELNQKTSKSTRFAVIVMHPEQKIKAREHFSTPLIFSIQEAKGLEYENVILYDFISAETQRFNEITRGVEAKDLLGEELRYARVKDKSDKSLEIFKFHINSLYVALTRAIKNIYLIESNPKHQLFSLLELKQSETGLDLAAYQSNLEDWRHEAHKLEMQGKEEQAEQIRSDILRLKTVPWEPLVGEALDQLHRRAIVDGNKKDRLLLFEYALVYQHRSYMNELVKAGFKPARQPEKGIEMLTRKHYAFYSPKHGNSIMRQVDQYGVDFRNPFNQTPLMISSRLGHDLEVSVLIDAGADTDLVNNAGFSAFQIALEQAINDPGYAKKKLGPVYQYLEPDNITVQTSGRLYQLDNRLMEFMMLNLMLAMFYIRLGDKIITGKAFTSGDFVEAVNSFPDHILPQRRKKRAYISSILSKNEMSRDEKYNRRLFRRTGHGQYVINPNLAVRVDGNWRNIYDLLQLDMINYSHDHDPVRARGNDTYTYNDFLEQQVEHFKSNFQKLRETAQQEEQHRATESQ